MNLQAAVVCHVGSVRTNNEDNYYLQGQIRQSVEELNTRAQFCGPDTQALFAVADGMGGEAQGEFASLAAVRALSPCSFEQGRVALTRGISKANTVICRESQRTGCRMGTTLAAVCIDAGKAVICNIGDSRVYFLREGSLSQLSTDHTQVQQMVDLGILTPEEVRKHPNRHILTQNLGIDACEMIIQPDFCQMLDLKDGDTFLLCSDGLTDMVEDAAIQTVLCSGTPEQQAQSLVDQAIQHGGKDNVTVLIVQVIT